VSLLLDFDLAGMIETLGDAFGFVDASLESSLENFKRFIEQTPHETSVLAAPRADRGTGATPAVG
jgi:hypothetical protein